MNRRTFMKAMAATALVTAAGPAFACRNAARLGVQLYTVRDRMAADGVEKTLKGVHEAGYGSVEFAGYYDHSAKDVRRMLDAIGLVSPSTHVPIDMFENSFDAVLDFAAEVGHKYIVLPWLQPEDRTLDKFKSIADTLNKTGEKAKAAGMAVAYHNHDFEFEMLDGEQPYEILLERTDAGLVKLELDLYWLNVAGVDALDIIRRFPGRVPLMHVKDRTAAGDMTEVGKGAIDFARIFEHRQEAGLEYYMVEHDGPKDSLASIRSSSKYLNATFPWLQN